MNFSLNQSPCNYEFHYFLLAKIQKTLTIFSRVFLFFLEFHQSIIKMIKIKIKSYKFTLNSQISISNNELNYLSEVKLLTNATN